MKAWFLAALAGAALAAGASPVAAGEPKDGKDLAPIWYEHHAGARDLAAAFPKAAFDQKITGEVGLECAADAKGMAIDCKIVEETPAGMGFGAAALGLAPKERVKTNDRNGQPVGNRRFRIGFTFLAPGDANPDWMKKPTGRDLAGVFPVAAAKKHIDGKATITCQVDIEGFLRKCEVVSEDPQGLGFGQAALQLSPQFRMTPKIRGGKPVPAGEVTIPINWQGFANYDPPSQRGESLVLDPPWETTPNAEQVRAAWPKEAKDATAGQVALRCELDKTGDLTNCDTISELPSGRGFGKAARSLVPLFKVRFSPDQAKDLRQYSIDVPFRFRDPAAPDGRLIGKPRWTRTLTPEGMALAFPQAAVKAQVFSGVGAVNCAIDVHGGLTDCQVRREEPAGLDFGAAAMEAAKLMAMNPWSTEGEPLDGLRITLPIRFKLDNDEAAKEEAPAAPAKP